MRAGWGWLVLMFASAAVAIALGAWAGDWPDVALAVGVLALCCLGLAYGHDALPTKGRDRRRRERAENQARFEAASQAAYEQMVERARARKSAW